MAESRDNTNTLDTQVRHIKKAKQRVYDVIFTCLNAQIHDIGHTKTPSSYEKIAFSILK